MSSQSSIRWISYDVVLAIHEAQIAEHGGDNGIRDWGLLESALQRPRNAYDYERSVPPKLAALYALGIIKNHPFLDGNKRVGAVLLEFFLEDNGYRLDADDAELLSMIVGAASSDLSEADFIRWVEQTAVEQTAKDA